MPGYCPQCCSIADTHDSRVYGGRAGRLGAGAAAGAGATLHDVETARGQRTDDGWLDWEAAGCGSQVRFHLSGIPPAQAMDAWTLRGVFWGYPPCLAEPSPPQSRPLTQLLSPPLSLSPLSEKSNFDVGPVQCRRLFLCHPAPAILLRVSPIAVAISPIARDAFPLPNPPPRGAIPDRRRRVLATEAWLTLPTRPFLPCRAAAA